MGPVSRWERRRQARLAQVLARVEAVATGQQRRRRPSHEARFERQAREHGREVAEAQQRAQLDADGLALLHALDVRCDMHQLARRARVPVERAQRAANHLESEGKIRQRGFLWERA